VLMSEASQLRMCVTVQLDETDLACAMGGLCRSDKGGWGEGGEESTRSHLARLAAS